MDCPGWDLRDCINTLRDLSNEETFEIHSEELLDAPHGTWMSAIEKAGGCQPEKQWNQMRTKTVSIKQIPKQVKEYRGRKEKIKSQLTSHYN